jgi:hypothetical protein
MRRCERCWPYRFSARSYEPSRHPARVLARRLAELPEPPAPIQPPVPWCGESGDPQSRIITVTLADGTDAAAFCPHCSPQEMLKNITQYKFDRGEVSYFAR